MKNAPIKVPEKKIPSTSDAALIIQTLQLLPHPEGGWYREVYRSDETIPHHSLPERYASPRCFSTSIYFMLENTGFSAFHRIASDETWHFYLGSAVIIYCIFSDGSTKQIVLGNKLFEDQVLQFTIPRNCWFAAKNLEANAFSLLGCTVAPGFEFSDFELGLRTNLLALYPEHSALISEFTRLT